MQESVPPAPGQESVWDYPRPPRLEPSDRHIEIIFSGVKIADTRHALRVLETSHPPVYYLPPADIQMQHLIPAPGTSYCEWKGAARYYTLDVDGRQALKAAWAYDQPSPPYQALAGYIAFYPRPMDACWVNGERVTPQPGEFYGGWITSDIVGPFKGAPGTMGW